MHVIFADREYVHYHTLRDRFSKLLNDVVTSLGGRGDIILDRAEMTYVNVLRPGPNVSYVGYLKRTFHAAETLPESSDNYMYNYSRPITSAQGLFSGRVHVALQSVWAPPDPNLQLILNLTARSADQNSDNVAFDVLEIHDLAHSNLNNEFRQVVTEDALTEWGLQ